VGLEARPADRVGAVLVVHGEVVDRGEPRGHGLDGARLVRVAQARVVERRRGRRDAEHADEVAAGRGAERAEAAGIDAEARGAGAQEAHRGLDVLDGGREARLTREAVVEARDGGAGADERAISSASMVLSPMKNAPPWMSTISGTGPEASRGRYRSSFCASDTDA